MNLTSVGRLRKVKPAGRVSPASILAKDLGIWMVLKDTERNGPKQESSWQVLGILLTAVLFLHLRAALLGLLLAHSSRALQVDDGQSRLSIPLGSSQSKPYSPTPF